MLNNKFKQVIQNLDKNIENKTDLIYAKSQITELAMEYLEQLEQLESTYKQKITIFENRLNELENTMMKLESQDYQDKDNEEYADLEQIKCPYCSVNFFIEFDETQKEIKCPACKNIIELDWGNLEDDM